MYQQGDREQCLVLTRHQCCFYTSTTAGNGKQGPKAMLSHIVQWDWDLMYRIPVHTSSTVSAGSSLTSSDRHRSWLEARISLVRSVCSHQRSAAPKERFWWASSGVSRLIRHTCWGTASQNTGLSQTLHTPLKPTVSQQLSDVHTHGYFYRDVFPKLAILSALQQRLQGRDRPVTAKRKWAGNIHRLLFFSVYRRRRKAPSPWSYRRTPAAGHRRQPRHVGQPGTGWPPALPAPPAARRPHTTGSPRSPSPRPRPARLSCPLFRAARIRPCGTAGLCSSAARLKPARGSPARALRAAAIPRRSAAPGRHRPAAGRAGGAPQRSGRAASLLVRLRVGHGPPAAAISRPERPRRNGVTATDRRMGRVEPGGKAGLWQRQGAAAVRAAEREAGGTSSLSTTPWKEWIQKDHKVIIS